MGTVGHETHETQEEADNAMSVQRIKSFQEATHSLCRHCTVDKWIGRKLGTSVKPLVLQHLCVQSCSVCLLKIGAFKVHLHCASFIKLIRVSTVMFWPALQVSNSQFKTITLPEQSLHFLFVYLFACLFPFSSLEILLGNSVNW